MNKISSSYAWLKFPNLIFLVFAATVFSLVITWGIESLAKELFLIS
ncbi:MAG: hypothetical protein ABL925_05570 [Methylococcales bacterium]